MKKTIDFLEGRCNRICTSFFLPLLLTAVMLFIGFNTSIACNFLTSFSLLDYPAHPVIPGCTNTGIRMELYNSDEVLPSPTITLTLTVDPTEFTISPSNPGGFPLTPTSVPSANPLFPNFVDYSRTIVLDEGEFLPLDFGVVVPTSYSLDLNKEVTILLTVTVTGCSAQTAELEFFPSFTKQIGANGNTTSLMSVATDDPTDGFTELNALYSVINGDISAVPHQDVVINGTLDVDMDYAFNPLSNLYMMPNAKIQAQKPGSIFIIDGTKIKSCDAMWQSIEVSNGAALGLWDSEIEDGNIAVDLKAGGSAECNDNTFNKNDIGVLATGAITYLSFDGNTVTTTGTLKSGQKKPSVGVKLVNVPSAVDLFGSHVNSYSNLYNGIIATGTRVTVKNSSFEDITAVPTTVVAPFSGHAIHVENTTGSDRKLTQEGFGDGTGSPVSFNNCTFGIFNLGTNMDVKENHMTNMVTGIESRNCQNKDISIKQNRITASLTGIGMYQNSKVKSAYIEDNLVNVVDVVNTTFASNATGIRVDENPAVGGLYYRILENTVDIGFGLRGIAVNGGNILPIRYNTVLNSGTVAEGCVGIDVSNSRNVPIYCNSMDGNTLGSNTVGLHVENSFNTNGVCNITEEHNIGVNYFGMCDGTKMRGNQMTNENIGFLLGYANATSPAGYIGEQRYHGNLWSGSFGSFPAWFPGATFNYAFQHRFLIDPNQTPAQLLLQDPPGVNPNSGWFIPQAPTYETTYTCPTSGCSGDPDFPDNLTDFDGLIANGGDLGAGICVAATNWTAKRQLYARLKYQPSLVSGNLLMQSFLSAQANTTVGAFYEIEHQIDLMMTLSANDDSNMSNNRASMDTKTNDIASISAQLNGGGLNQSQIAQLKAQRSQLQSDINGLQQQNDALVGSIATQRATTASQIRQSNNAITASQLYEQNQQQVNDIYLQTIAVGNTAFTTAQLNTLLSIASQCALCGGDGVYLARSLYAVADPNMKFVDEQLCASAQPIKQPTVPEESGFTVSMLPNPASYWITLEMNGQESFDGEVQFFDVTGKLIGSQPANLTEGEPFLLDLSNLQTGFYAVKILKNSKTVLTDKLIIAR